MKRKLVHPDMQSIKYLLLCHYCLYLVTFSMELRGFCLFTQPIKLQFHTCNRHTSFYL